MKVWKRVKALLDKKQVNHNVSFIVHSNSEDQLQMIKKEIIELHPKAIIVIGGDGTIHHCLSLLVNTNIPLGVIPAGSGNDFARALKIPKSTKRAFQRILQGETKKIDLMSVNKHLCVTVVGIGLDAMVTNVVHHSQLKKYLNYIYLGRFSYVIGLFKAIFLYKPINIVLMMNDSKMYVEKVWLIAVGNTAYYGGGLKICPRAVETDGKLNICIVHSLTRLQLLTLFPLAFFGKHPILKGVSIFSASELTVQTEQSAHIQADGEELGCDNLARHISVFPSTLNIIN